MKMKTLQNNKDLTRYADVLPDIVYSEQTGQKLTLLVPWTTGFKVSGMVPDLKNDPRPLIVFIQGSGWTSPDIYHEMAQLAPFVKRGYTVATIEHRSSAEGHPFPAFLEDTKCAIRFLRRNAALYDIDPDRVAVWGTSSGGNTALLVAATQDDPQYKTEEYAEYSDSVCACVSCFGPIDIRDMLSVPKAEYDVNLMARALFGKDLAESEEEMKAMSPCCRVSEDRACPPILLMHGTADTMVPFEQMLKMCDVLDKNGKEFEACRVESAGHENDFWSDEAFAMIADFLDRKVRA